MGDLFYWYFIGVLACVPYVFYDMGIFLTNESYSKVAWSRGERFGAFLFYLLICLGSWVVFILDTFAFICDLVVGIKGFGRTVHE